MPQMLSSDAVDTGVGVYWMFYSGGSMEAAPAPAIPELEIASTEEAIGLRSSSLAPL